MREHYDIETVLTAAQRRKPRRRLLAIVFVGLLVVLTGGIVIGLVVWNAGSAPITALHAADLTAQVAATARVSGRPPQSLWADIRHLTHTPSRDDMTEGDYVRAMKWLKSEARPR